MSEDGGNAANSINENLCTSLCAATQNATGRFKLYRDTYGYQVEPEKG